MIYESDFSSLLPHKNGKCRLLGLDVGDKTIGLSLSDPTWVIASPFKLINRHNNIRDYSEIQQIIEEFNVAGLIIGLPLTLRGEEGPQAEKVRTYVTKLDTLITIPSFFWDERLSTVAVTRTLLEGDVSRKRRRQVVDKMAATFILQGVLDYLSRYSREPLP